MCTGAYIATAHIDHVAMLHIDHVGCEAPGNVSCHALPWNREVPAPGVAKHSATTLVTLDGGNNSV